ncbi:bZIP transcription factor family protein [Tripterygium wilfordii]|uniref:BZIP transcription factor family protein n=1 Tax=Tripterygium wilfordii TaxID=458696 RepID=A0A7J7CZ33_TRIWF|nr:bZIP transcription factor 44-like [Tripterygium wilfordii]XP_038717152.1 bZIP transcription factor 44-like [Tripterygium wilfordii]XP_038717153.1 bZIP transcription factor 44-like [Tripterygium wilfordii]KAF5739367.1 bZIP transcription factor family protein [Tripterygium wilfordii]
MASSSGNSSSVSITQLQNSGSEEEMMDQRKRKRKQSNRESARRSRMRKQKHLDDLMAGVVELRKENDQIFTSINVKTQNLLNIEAENSILRAQMMELGHRLESLSEILHFINNPSNGVFETHHHHEDMLHHDHDHNLLYLNQQPIMASADYTFPY